MPWENSRPNREPSEWLTMTTDALLAQSAVDRLTSGAHHLIIEGPSYRQCQRVGPKCTDRGVRDALRHVQVVPYSCQQRGPISLASDTQIQVANRLNNASGLPAVSATILRVVCGSREEN